VRRLTPIDLPPWSLPLIALAISAPIVAAFALGGPAGGMAAGALVAAAILVVAARSRFDEEIEVARRSGPGGVLVVATAAVEGGAAVDAVRAARARAEGEAGVLVLAPALNTKVSHWLSDLRRARLEAQERLAVSLAVLATAGVDARGSVGDSDPLQATEDTLRSFAASEVVFVIRDRSDTRIADEVRRRLDRRVTEVGGTEDLGARDELRQPSNS
jgi:hypothetical protein